MATLTLPADSHAAVPPPATRTADAWRLAGLALLSVRFIQGFIYWGGGSRRFIYAPSKLDPHAASWMANKFQSAMPGALLGTDHVISFMLHHFDLLYASLIVFSAAELIAGVFLMAGLFTRAAALVSVGFSIALMLMFGWQGATCIDEWTMAASNLAMGATLILAGGGAFSLDAAWLRRRPALASQAWFRWAAGALPLPLPDRTFRNVALAVFAATAAFNLATYDYYRGSIVTAFHGGPVSPAKHHIAVADVRLLPGGAVRFHADLDGAHIGAGRILIAADPVIGMAGHVDEVARLGGERGETIGISFRQSRCPRHLGRVDVEVDRRRIIGVPLQHAFEQRHGNLGI